ncbi:glycosyltransferase involved in cell wall biosynthesis [Marisediminicola sp. UYEF4]|uniref:glycosyltransferase n=1 Tax=Marisediminicola sp. UYEF4 TaxID=1756384 RepID=UPI0033946E80
MIGQILGRPVFFELAGDGHLPDWLMELSERNRLLLLGAANFHALENQGAPLALEVYVASPSAPPHFTDLGTRTGDLDESAVLVGSLEIRSIADGERSLPPLDGSTGSPFIESGVRHIQLAGDTGGSLEIDRHISPYWRLRRDLEQSFPNYYDSLRQLVLSRRERSLQSHVIARVDRVPGDEPIVPAGPAAEDARGAAIFGLHWLEIGGAERWAIQTVTIAAQAGLLPIVITDRESQHDWVTRPELDGAIVLPLTHPTGDGDGSQNLLRAILENVDVRGVYLHHCQWLYDRLPWIKHCRPDVAVVDSLHIIEYAGGGYPAIGAHFDNYIDTHHVISPQLATWLHDVQRVDESKIVLAPLVELTSDQSGGAYAPRASADAFTISFIGRFVRQKRPYLFLRLVKELAASSPVPIRAIMQGGGELDSVVTRLIDRFDLGSVVELRAHDSDVDSTLDDSDVLVVSSQNEGLTLTTLEAIARGIPVLSTDVGSQNTLIGGESLVPRAPGPFIEQAAATIIRFAVDDDRRRDAWTEQMTRARQFSDLPQASEWAQGVLKSWTK